MPSAPSSLNCLSAVEAIGSGMRCPHVQDLFPGRLNCLSAVEAIGRGRYPSPGTTGATCGLNCLSAVEAIGSSPPNSKSLSLLPVSIAFRLLKRLVAGWRT